MPNLRNILLLIVLGLFHQFSIAQDIVINEIMSDNENSILDSSGDTPDWIELYNRGTSIINLEGYYLSDDKDDLQKWTFPAVTIAPNSFLLIFASGKDLIGISSIHTNFKISAEGEKIYLSNSQEIKIDEFEKIDLKADESYGRLPDGGDQKFKLPYYSPGATNNSANVLTFSHEPGFYTEPFNLSVNSITGDSIFCTMDGSDPTPTSNYLKDEIFLEDKTSSPNIWSEIPTTPTQNLITNPAWESPGYLIPKSNSIRCASFKHNKQTSKVYTKSFFIGEKLIDEHSMPIIALISDQKNLFDDQTGIYVPGNSWDPADPEWSGNYFIDEIESERPIHIEYFTEDGIFEFGQDAGVRIHGGKTRHASQKSLKLYARKRYGEKYFNYPLMPQNGVEKYQRFLLQTTMASWGGDTVIKDILAHEISRDLDFEKMDYRPAVVFLNGEYWGIHHIRDRIDEEYLSYTSGIDIDSLEIDRVGNSHYNALKNFMKNNVPIDNQELNYISTQMDIDCFIDYQIAEMFLSNHDWPSNNTRHWRPKFDGKWRWIFFDLDAGFGDPTVNMLEYNTNQDSSINWPNGAKETFLFRTLIENENFQNQFLNRYKELIETDFQFKVTKKKLFALINEYETEMPNHIKRWKYPVSMDTWLNDIEINILDFLEERPCKVVENIHDFFDLPNFDVNCKDSTDTTSQPENESFTISPNPNNGIFTISNNSTQTKLFQYRIFNALGQKSAYGNHLLVQPDEQKTIDASQLPSGWYYLQIQEQGLWTTIPIAIVKH